MSSSIKLAGNLTASESLTDRHMSHNVVHTQDNKTAGQKSRNFLLTKDFKIKKTGQTTKHCYNRE
jgi:hypothetical protein